jgi:hypothetical protein
VRGFLVVLFVVFMIPGNGISFCFCFSELSFAFFFSVVRWGGLGEERDGITT